MSCFAVLITQHITSDLKAASQLCSMVFQWKLSSNKDSQVHHICHRCIVKFTIPSTLRRDCSCSTV